MNLKLLGTGSGDSHTGADTELPLQPQGSESGRETNLSDIPEHVSYKLCQQQSHWMKCIILYLL